MRNYWKQLGVWATRSKDDPFVSARFKLTLVYAFSIIIVFGISYFALEFGRSPVWVFILLALLVIFISYFLSSRALYPIRNIMRAQKRFIADASHELRTPLSIMKINSEVALMGNGELDPKEAAETIVSNLEEINRMSKLIEQLLSLSFYDNRMVEIPSIPVDFSLIVEEIVEKTKSLAHHKNIRLNKSNNKMKPLMVDGNPTALEQLVMNLVRNAIIYTPSGGEVSVSIEESGKNVILKVKDSGIGIAPEDLPNIFKPFYKTDKINPMAGTGLGLTIVKKIVDRHNGFISVESELGKGTLFKVTMPTI